jgi:dihydroorotate dehydrogenase
MAFIACGGLGSGADAARALQDGAALVQIYSSLIFEGPFLVGRMNRYLAGEPATTLPSP